MAAIFLLFLTLFASSHASNSTEVQYGCFCKCCSPCEIPGSVLLPLNTTCGESCTMDWCIAAYPTECGSAWDVENTCGVATPTLDWSGSFSVQAGDECLTPPNTPAGSFVGCSPPCDQSECNCMSGHLDITQNPDGTMTFSVDITPIYNGTTSRYSGTFYKTGDSGLVAYGSFDGIDVVYDVERMDNAIQFFDRPNNICLQSCVISASSTDYLELGLICGAAGVAAVAFGVFCFCNPCKKKKKPQDGQLNNPNAQKPVSAPYTALAGDDRRRK